MTAALFAPPAVATATAGAELALYDQAGKLIGSRTVPATFLPYPGLRFIYAGEVWEVAPAGVQVLLPDPDAGDVILIEVRVRRSECIHDAAWPEVQGGPEQD